MKVAAFIANQLARTRTPVFFYPGINLASLDVALEKAGARTIVLASENAIPHACSGFFQATGKVGVGIVGSGPAATNLLTGLATASADKIPLIAINVTIPLCEVGTGAFQDLDMTATVKPLLGESVYCREGKELYGRFRQALHSSHSSTKGPTFIGTSPDALEDDIGEPSFFIPSIETFQPKVITTTPSKNSFSRLEQSLQVCEDLFDFFVVGNGLNKYEVLRSLPGKRFISSDRFGCMGFGLPAAIGVSVGLNRSVILFIGDGDLIMSISELATLLRYNIPVKIVLLNNHNFFAGLNQIREKNGLRVPCFENPSFQELSNAFGLKYFYARDTDIRTCLSEALSFSGPALIEVPCTITIQSSEIKAIRNFILQNTLVGIQSHIGRKEAVYARVGGESSPLPTIEQEVSL
jgi:thiamine pyrophosphate-dependent acetolactate synthase large subunit-like protein